MPRPKPTPLFQPGSCTMRLADIETLTSPSKRTLLQSISNDITATFIYIARQAEAGRLSARHTAPINDVVRIIKDTEVSQRRMLERRVARYERQVQRLRDERRWMRKEFGRVVKQVEVVHGHWKDTIGRLRRELRAPKQENVV